MPLILYYIFFRTQDVKVKDVVIPSNTMITPIMAEILKGEHWTEGDKFRPERFLDGRGDVIRFALIGHYSPLIGHYSHLIGHQGRAVHPLLRG